MELPGQFFDTVRPIFDGRLTQEQVDGITRLAGEGIERRLMVTETAYVLATAKWETGHRMQPVKEYGGEAYHFRMYDIEGARPWKARELGNLQPGDGVRFPGRGDVQLTGRGNYARMGERYGIDLVGNPDLALDPEISKRIIYDGMLDGIFTGRKLGGYITRTTTDYRGARRIVNGTDRAALIAGYAKRFEQALGFVDMPDDDGREDDDDLAASPEVLALVEDLEAAHAAQGELLNDLRAMILDGDA